MGIMDKVKELGDEILKTVEDSGLKENVKCATMVIKDTVKDTVEKGKKELETKIEENKQKIEAEKKLIRDLEENTELNVANNFQLGVSGIDTEKMMEFADEFSEKICAIKCSLGESKLTFGKYSSEKNVEKILSSWDEPVLSEELEVEIVEENIEATEEKVEVINEVVEESTTENEEVENEEKSIFCYNGGRKGLFLLTNENFYLKMKHPEHKITYSAKIATDKIQSIFIVNEEDKNILKINGVEIGLVENDVVELLNKYLYKINNKAYEISIDEMIEEIQKVKFVESKVVLEIINHLKA